MTEEKKPTPRKPRAPRKPAASTAKPRADARQPRKAKYSDDLIAAARALWEGDPKITKVAVAEEMGIPYAMVDKWSKGGADGKGEKWCKRVAENMSERAHAAADTYKTKLSELGPEITAEQKNKPKTRLPNRRLLSCGLRFWIATARSGTPHARSPMRRCRSATSTRRNWQRSPK